MITSKAVSVNELPAVTTWLAESGPAAYRTEPEQIAQWEAVPLESIVPPEDTAGQAIRLPVPVAALDGDGQVKEVLVPSLKVEDACK